MNRKTSKRITEILVDFRNVGMQNKFMDSQVKSPFEFRDILVCNSKHMYYELLKLCNINSEHG